MNMSIFLVVVCIGMAIHILIDARKNGLSRLWSLLVILPPIVSVLTYWGDTGLFIGILGYFIYFIIRYYIKRKNKNNTRQEVITKDKVNFNVQSKEVKNIPDTCPHCKNPNTKRTITCEWCGSETC